MAAPRPQHPDCRCALIYVVTQIAVAGLALPVWRVVFVSDLESMHQFAARASVCRVWRGGQTVKTRMGAEWLPEMGPWGRFLATIRADLGRGGDQIWHRVRRARFWCGFGGEKGALNGEWPPVPGAIRLGSIRCRLQMRPWIAEQCRGLWPLRPPEAPLCAAAGQPIRPKHRPTAARPQAAEPVPRCRSR